MMEVDEAVVAAHELLDQHDAAAAASGGGGMMMDDGPDSAGPVFPALAARDMMGPGQDQMRRIAVPPHRFTPLREQWASIFTPIAEHMKLHVRVNVKARRVELKTCEATEDPGALQKAADFVKAFTLGFDVQDAVALLRVDELYIDSFEVTDVKPLSGDHLSRAIGRIAGKGGKTKFTIENATKTRIVLADSKVHILGAYQNIRMARDAIADLIMGSPPGKVYGKLHAMASRMSDRF